VGEDTETAILAGGCFWILQQLLRDRDGVISTKVGFTGGANERPTEQENVGHAEAVEVSFDPRRLPYGDLLELFFLVHRPDLDETQVGSAYRSEIFCTTDGQRLTAEEKIRVVDASGHWPGPLATKVSEAGRFWESEPAEQDYLHRYPDAPPPF
jgi:peptide-methionine (S)-S-oxide reductase